MIKARKNKKIQGILSYIIAMAFIFASVATMNVKAEDSVVNLKSNINNEIKPQINVNYLGSTPESPMVGQDFTVRYEIDPLPFYNNTSGDKEIVLVLDVSGSMKNDSKLTNLKIAAMSFIDALTVTADNKVTPKITNLKIGIVTFSNYGSISSDLLEVTNETSINEVNKNSLKKIINNLSANGGTNTGDGLRKGAYLLDKANPAANKTLIFMADGEPTYYSYEKVNQRVWSCSCSKSSCGKSSCTSENPCTENHGTLWQKKYCDFKTETVEEYYTSLDNTNPSRGGSGSNDRDGKSLKYSTIIGNIIKDKKYNVFSIGYGLGNSDSAQNIKMKKIHESMGGVTSGEKSTFFATDSGAIDVVFKSIADTLISSYTIGDVELNLDLGDNLIAVDGFETSDGMGGKISIKPIIYNKNDNNQYIAEKQIIEITLRAEVEGEIELLKDSSFFKYKDINGNNQSTVINSNTLIIRPFSIENAEKLDVDFKSIPEEYLVGDVITGKVTFTHNGMVDIKYEDAMFTLDNNLPSNLTFTNNSSNKLNFGNVTSTINKDYNLLISDDDGISIDSAVEYKLKGKYSYNLVKGNTKTEQTGEKEALVKVKRGVIKAKIIDEAGNDITTDSKLSIESKSSNKVNGIVNEGYITFNNVKSGDYILAIEELPKGCEPQENGSSTVLRVDYNNNVAEIIFRVNGVSEEYASEILNHGIYMQNTANDISKMLMESGEDGSISVASGIPLSIGVIVDVKDKSTKVELSSSQGTNDFGNIKLYKFEGASLKPVEGKNTNKNVVELNHMETGKYLIIYRFTPNNSSIRLNAKIVDSISSKVLNLKIEGKEMPNLF